MGQARTFPSRAEDREPLTAKSDVLQAAECGVEQIRSVSRAPVLDSLQDFG